MTVSVPSNLVRSYAGDGSTVNFSYPIRFDADDELVVVLRSAGGVDTTQTLGPDYTVSGEGTASGSVTFLTAPASGVTVLIYRATEETQVVDLEDAARNPAEAVELQMDRTVRMIQDHKELLSRSVVMRPGSQGVVFPEPSDGKFIGWNGSDLANFAAADVGGELLPLVANTIIKRNAANTAFETKPVGTTGLDVLGAETQAEAQTALDVYSKSEIDERAVTFATVAIASALTPDTAPDFMRTAGHTAAGDGGGAVYKKVASEPSHAGKFSITLSDAVTVVWYELAELVATPMMFGAVGNGVADDTASLQNMLDSDYAVFWGDQSRVYRITSGLSTIPAKPVFWHSDGATILLDSPSNIRTAVMVNTPGHDVDIIGRLRLDCQQKAFIGFFFQNSSGTFCDFSGKGLQVRNVYRASTAFTGGDGIWVRGGFRNIYLERPDVRGVLMANGAGVTGYNGVGGITISAMTLAPQEVTIVHPWIEGVYSEDSSYLFDQDGIKIFGAEDDGTPELLQGHFTLVGGKIKNCGGRGVKSQMEFGIVTGTHFVRDGVEVPQIAREGSMPEIDFQTGGGIVENIECRYLGSAPNRIVQLTGSRQVTPIRYGAGAKVDGIRISRTGSYQLDSLVDIAPKFETVPNFVPDAFFTPLGSVLRT